MLTKEELRLGDTVRLRNGETIVVDGVSDWYEDRTGRHVGPWVMTPPTVGGIERYPLADVVETVVSNPRVCRFCGNGVTAKTETTDFCRYCYHSGVAFNDIYAAERQPFVDAFPDAHVGFEHTGGGCWWFAIYPKDSPWYWAMTNGEAAIPKFQDGEGWAIVVRYHTDDDHPDYEGALVVQSERPVLTHHEVITFVQADMKEVGL